MAATDDKKQWLEGVDRYITTMQDVRNMRDVLNAIERELKHKAIIAEMDNIDMTKGPFLAIKEYPLPNIAYDIAKIQLPFKIFRFMPPHHGITYYSTLIIPGSEVAEKLKAKCPYIYDWVKSIRLLFASENDLREYALRNGIVDNDSWTDNVDAVGQHTQIGFAMVPFYLHFKKTYISNLKPNHIYKVLNTKNPSETIFIKALFNTKDLQMSKAFRCDPHTHQIYKPSDDRFTAILGPNLLNYCIVKAKQIKKRQRTD